MKYDIKEVFMRCLNFTKVSFDMTIAFLFIINNLTLNISLPFYFFLKASLGVWVN